MYKFLTREKRPASTATAMANFFVGDSLLYLFTFVASIARIRLYQINEYGIFQMALSMVPVVSTAIVLGFPTLLLTSIPKLDRENRYAEIRVIVTAGILFVLFLDLAVLILSVSALQFSVLSAYRIAIIVLPLMVFGSAVSRIANSTLLALNKSRSIVGLNFLNLFVGTILTIGVYLIVQDIFVVLVCYGIGGVVLALYQVFFLLTVVRGGAGKETGPNTGHTGYGDAVRKSMSYGRWDLPTSLMWNAYSSVSLIVLSTSAGLDAVGYLAFALSVTTVVFVPFTKISDVLLQELCREHNGRVSETVVKSRESQNTLLPLLAVAVSLSMLAATVLVRTFFGSKYGASLPYVFILSCSVPAQFLMYLMRNVPVSHRQIKLANIPEIYAFAFFAIIIYPSVLIGGGIGAAVALFASRVMVVVFMLLVYGQYRSFSYGWMSFLLLMPVSCLFATNYLWIVPYLFLLAFLVHRQRSIFSTYLREARAYFGVPQSQTSGELHTKKPRILYISASNVLRPAGYRTRVLSELAHVSRREVRLFYVPLLYCSWWSPSGVKALRSALHGIATLLPVPFVPALRLGYMGRTIQLWSAVCAVVAIAGFLKVRVVHAHGNYAAHIAAKAKKFLDLRVVFDMHGLAPEELQASELPDAQKEEVVRTAHIVEAECVAGADRIICVSNAMARHLISKYGPDTRVHIVPCAVDTEKFSYARRSYDQVRIEQGLTDKMVFVYAGDLSQYQCIEDMVRLFAFIKKKIPASILAIYTMDGTQELGRLLRKYNIPSEDCRIGFVSHETIGKYLQMCDVGLLLREDIPLNKVACPTKLAEYMASGLPVIATPYIGDIVELFDRARLGFLTKLGNGFEETMISFLDDVREHRTEWGSRCCEFSGEFLSWTVQADVIVQVYKELCDEMPVLHAR